MLSCTPAAAEYGYRMWREVCRDLGWPVEPRTVWRREVARAMGGRPVDSTGLVMLVALCAAVGMREE